MGFVSKKRGRLVHRPFKGRKANILHEIYLLIFQFVMVFLVALALLQYINNVATDLGFEKRFTSIDLGLLTTTIYTAPGTMKHVYYLPINFPVPMNFIFQNSLVDIMESGEELHMAYWFLSDYNLDPLEEDMDIRASASAREMQSESSTFGDVISAVMEDWEAGLISITYYKTGRQVRFNGADANPMQIVCPIVNTTNENWESEKIYIMKVLPDAADYSNQTLPANRIAQILDASFTNFQASGAGAQASGAGSSLISAIPDDAKIVIGVGDAGGERDFGSLVIYFPVDANVMKARKLACFLLNDLLTPDTVVYYAQVMPVYTDMLESDSRLKVFEEKSGEDQIMVFIDLEPFTEDQVDSFNTANAIYRALQRYYGVRDLPMSMDPTFSFTLAGARSRRPSTALGLEAAAPGVASRPPGAYGQLMSEEDKSQLLAELARENNYDYATLKAFFTVESGGRGFGPEGQLKIRMEPHVFNRTCNCNSGTFGEPGDEYNKRKNRRVGGVACGSGQTNEHECLARAIQINEEAAYSSISMGIPQIMGFHKDKLGYSTAKEMFEDFNRGEEVQIRKFIEFINMYSHGQMAEAIRAQDWVRMACLYNGRCDGQVYAPRLQTAYAAAQQEPLYQQFAAAGAIA